MGRYLDIARKGAAKRQAAAALDVPTLSQQEAEAIADDGHAIDLRWLIDHRPEVWERMQALDSTLVDMEHHGASDTDYRTTLTVLIAYVHAARVLYARRLPSPPH